VRKLISSTLSDAKDLDRSDWLVLGFGIVCALFALVSAVLVFVLVPWPGGAVGAVFVVIFVGLSGVVLNGIRELAESQRALSRSKERYEACLKAYNDRYGGR
jgi:hypothetical protein